MSKNKIQATLDTLPQTGKITWIGLRPQKNVPMQVVTQSEITEENGLVGDRYNGSSRKRQVTLIQAEHLTAVANFLQKDKIDPVLTKRNIVVEGINLLAFKDRKFQIGETVILEMTGLCHPCTKMETNLGAGGLNAMRGHGGITTKVIQGGEIKVGDQVQLRRAEE